MHIDLNTLIALGVFVHLGASLSRTLLHRQSDRDKITRFEQKTDEVLSALTAVAQALQSAGPAPTSGGSPT